MYLSFFISTIAFVVVRLIFQTDCGSNRFSKSRRKKKKGASEHKWTITWPARLVDGLSVCADSTGVPADKPGASGSRAAPSGFFWETPLSAVGTGRRYDRLDFTRPHWLVHRAEALITNKEREGVVAMLDCQDFPVDTSTPDSVSKLSSLCRSYIWDNIFI